MNKQIKLLKEEYSKYPYLIERDLEILFHQLVKENINSRKNKSKDIIRTIKLLKDDLQYLIDNEVD